MTKDELQKILDRWGIGAAYRKEHYRYNEEGNFYDEKVIGLCWLPKDVSEYAGIFVRQACAEDIEKRLGNYAAFDADKILELIKKYIKTDKRVLG
ncbi:MAG: hypothetical protein LBP40_06105 [Campylobacteraceae bacterium]|jgi:hypothetical protein|nr:hypothetical protein [Campylobacteraceae bacterium]